MPNSSGSLTAVIVSGGKQYWVASGDRILVDRVAAEPGSELTLDRVLMVADGEELKLGAEALAGQSVTVRVLEHRRGPKIDVLRYRPKKRVRVHRGARADLTALEVLSIGPQEQPRRTRTTRRQAAETTGEEPGRPAPAVRRARASGRAPAAEAPAADETADVAEAAEAVEAPEAAEAPAAQASEAAEPEPEEKG